jgi:hypothetical protein
MLAAWISFAELVNSVANPRDRGGGKEQHARTSRCIRNYIPTLLNSQKYSKL